MNMCSYMCCQADTQPTIDIHALSRLLKIVAEPSRLQILCILNQGTRCVCELIEHTRLSQSLISHHLKDMKNVGLVYDEKQGQRVNYSLTDTGKHMCTSLFSLIKD